MIADVFAARASGHACRAMCIGSSGRDRRARIVAWERAADRAPAPGARQIEPVEMHDIRIAAVADNGRTEQGPRLAPLDPGQEAREPIPEFAYIQDASHP